MLTPQKILENIFGYDKFRPLQEKVITNVLDKKDTLVLMPTGGGKSLCYQIPAMIFKGITIVVSPLISLMKDQVEQLNQAGVEAVFLNSSLSNEEYQKNISLVKENRVKLLYLAPETLLLDRTLALLSSIKVDCFTIDEAHCISEWGHDFRPEYRKIAEVRKHFKNSVCIALTATATERVREDIKKSLEIDSANDFVDSFNRANLFIQVTQKTYPFEQIKEYIGQRKNQSGIIYCFSRKQVEEVSLKLEELGHSVKPYHAGLPDQVRHKNQELFLKDDVQIIVATVAFGMGINKSNVRFVIHYDLPKNIESYYQEIGRAGRDGTRADCLLLFSYGDIQKIKYFIDQKELKERKIAGAQLDKLVRYAETYECRRKPMLKYFGENYGLENCGMCDNCLGTTSELVDISTEAKKYLSCVKRSGETFGSAHIIGILQGSNSAKIRSKGHQNLSTFGIGKNYSQKQWQNFVLQFQQNQLIEREPEYNIISVTEKGMDVLFGRIPLMGTIPKDSNVDLKFDDAVEDTYDKKLFAILRKRRKQLADASFVPPYVIFSDKTIITMSKYKPQTPESFKRIQGVGDAKAKKYGKIFIKLIKEYCAQNKSSDKFIENFLERD